MNQYYFPKDFVWGVATASYQIEGAHDQDGRKPSIWDTFCRTPGKVVNGDTGDVACDHYNRYKEDVALLSQYGVDAYRFSIAWPRIFPDGFGAPNEAGMAFYINLVDELLAHNIKPVVTLYHWDLPQTLQDQGGWANRETIAHFKNYAAYVFDRLGDKVHQWITFNEPWVFTFLGNFTGEHAPGIQDLSTALVVGHNVLVAHGEAVGVYRQKGLTAPIGITLSVSAQYPASDAPEDLAASERMHAYTNSWFLDPIYKKQYPQNLWDWVECQMKLPMPTLLPGDLDIISRPIDFVGINYYFRGLIKAGNDPLGVERLRPEGQYTAMDWEVYPQGLYDIMARFQKDYGAIDLYITENGAAFPDLVSEDGQIHDKERTEYLVQHFQMAHKAVADGIPLKGYFVWSFLDNFEWACGYDKRFGITHMDYATQVRTVKDSGKWYMEVIKERGFEG